MADQLHHYNSKFTKKQFPIILVCDRVNSPANIGSIFRIADSFGVSQIYFGGEDINVVSKRMQRTSRSTHNVVPYQEIESSVDVIKKLKAEGHHILALEITKNSIPIHEYTFTTNQKLVLVIGEENFGVSEDIIALCDCCLHIEMYGINTSMNVANATGIALYEMVKQLEYSSDN